MVTLKKCGPIDNIYCDGRLVGNVARDGECGHGGPFQAKLFGDVSEAEAAAIKQAVIDRDGEAAEPLLMSETIQRMRERSLRG